MARIELAPEVLDDFERIVAHPERIEVAGISRRIGGTVAALDVLGHSPEFGRPAGGGMRELVIGRGARGYVALYRYVARIETVFVLAVRGPRR